MAEPPEDRTVIVNPPALPGAGEPAQAAGLQISRV